MAIKDQNKKGSKKTEKISEKKAGGTSIKSTSQKSSSGRKSEPAKTITGRSSAGRSSSTPEKDPKKKKSAAGEPARKNIKKTPASKKTKEKIPPGNLKIFLPEGDYSAEPLKTPFPGLPEEYGENELILMEVDPSVVFVSWEIKPDEISGKAGRLNIRVYDITGADVTSSQFLSKSGNFFDIPVLNRVDSKFYDLKMSGKEVVMEIGLLHGKKRFQPIARSNRVSIPERHLNDEPGIKGSAGKLFGY